MPITISLLAAASLAAPLGPQESPLDIDSIDGVDVDLSEDLSALATLQERGIVTIFGSAARGTDTEAWQIDWAPDGSRLLSVGTNGELDLWNAENGTRMAQTQLFDMDSFTMVTCARFLSNGEIAAFQDDGAMLILDGTSLKQLRQVDGIPVCSSLAITGRFSGDRRLAATLPGPFVEDGTHVIDTESGKRVAFFTDEAGFASDVAVSDDGKILAYLTHQGTHGSFVAAHRIEDGERLHADALVGLRDTGYEFERPLLNVALDPAGRRVAIGSYVVVLLFDLKKGELSETITGFGIEPKDMVFGPKGRVLYVGTDDGLIVRYEALKAKESCRTMAHLHGVYALALSPDGKRLASTGSDGAVRFWDAKTLAPLHAGKGPAGSPLCGHFEGDGATIVVGYSDGTLWRQSLGGGAPAPIQSGSDGSPITSIAPGPGGALRALTASGRCLLISNGSDKCQTESPPGASVPVTAAAVDTEGKRSAFGFADGSIVVLGADGPLLEATLGDPVISLGFEPMGTRFVALTDVGRGRTFDLASGEMIEDAGERDPADESPITLDLRWAAPGVVSIAVNDDRVALAEAQGEVLGIFGEDYAYGDGRWNGQVSYAISPDAKLVAMNGGGNGFELFHTGTGKRLARVDAGTRPATFAAFHPRGTHVAFGLPGGRVAVWNLDKLSALR